MRQENSTDFCLTNGGHYSKITRINKKAGLTDTEANHIAINFQVCNRLWKLTEILAHESWHSRTGKGGLYEDLAYPYGLAVRTSVFPWTKGIGYYGEPYIGWK